MLPYMTEQVSKKSKEITKFGGINQSEFRADNELVSSRNMSAQHYPCLSSSKGKELVLSQSENINGISHYNELYYTSSPLGEQVCNIHYGENSAVISDSVGEGERTFAAMSDQILVMPDKVLYTPSDNTVKPIAISKYYDTEAASEYVWQYLGNTVSVSPGVAEIGSNFIEALLISRGSYSVYCVNFDNIKEGDFIYVSAEIYVPNYSDYQSYKAYSEKIKKGFTLRVAKITEASTNVPNGTVKSNYLIKFDDNSIDTNGYDRVYAKNLTIEKRVPDFEHICTHGNRVWGVEGNTIRCSLLGDVSVWEDFSSDAYGTLPSSCYSLTVDTGGDFTGLCVYNGNIFAFKENCVHKIYGSQPEEYTLYTQSLCGVQKGAHKTLVCINGILYYKGCDGFYAYSGGIPVCISKKLDGNINAIAGGTDGTNYYVIAEQDGKRKMLVYYTDEKIWHTRDAGDDIFLVSSGTNLYAADKNSIYLINEKSSDKTQWEFEAEFDEGTFLSKCYTRLLIKYSLNKGGYFTVRTICDGNTSLTHISGDYGHGEDLEGIVVLPRIKCRRIKVIFEGRGSFTLKNITREYFLLKEGGN